MFGGRDIMAFDDLTRFKGFFASLKELGEVPDVSASFVEEIEKMQKQMAEAGLYQYR
jgi:hypothetical protein